jgi:hypothetical protein
MIYLEGIRIPMRYVDAACQRLSRHTVLAVLKRDGRGMKTAAVVFCRRMMWMMMTAASSCVVDVEMVV